MNYKKRKEADFTCLQTYKILLPNNSIEKLSNYILLYYKENFNKYVISW